MLYCIGKKISCFMSIRYLFQKDFLTGEKKIESPIGFCGKLRDMKKMGMIYYKSQYNKNKHKYGILTTANLFTFKKKSELKEKIHELNNKLQNEELAKDM